MDVLAGVCACTNTTLPAVKKVHWVILVLDGQQLGIIICTPKRVLVIGLVNVALVLQATLMSGQRLRVGYISELTTYAPELGARAARLRAT